MQTIIRKSPPSKWDHLPQDTLCRVEKSDTKTDVYIQRSSDESNPHWELLIEETTSK